MTFIAGQAVDLVWHASYEEFETASDQVQTHAVVWAGTLILMAASAAAVVRGTRNRGYLVVLAGTIAYAGVAAWLLWEHLQLRDPDLPTSCPSSRTSSSSAGWRACGSPDPCYAACPTTAMTAADHGQATVWRGPGSVRCQGTITTPPSASTW